VSKYSAASWSDPNEGSGVFAEGSFFFIVNCLLAAEQPPLLVLHVSGGHDANHTSAKAAKDHESQTAIERLTQRDVESFTSSSDFVITGKDFFDFIGSELVPLDMECIVIVPVKSRK